MRCCLAILPFLSLSAQTEERLVYYNDELYFRPEGSPGFDLEFRYQLTDGKMTGAFTAYYRDKKIKAQGQLENGQPSGEWKVYFPDGKLAAKRLYHSPNDFEVLYPPLPKNGPAALFGAYQPAPLKRDSSSCIAYRSIEEKDVWWEKRVFTWVPATAQNKVLFEDNRLWNVLWPPILAGELIAFAGKEFNGKFQRKVTMEEIRALDFSHCRLLGMQLKEVFFFDKDLMSMVSRIIGLCPVFLEESSGDTLRPFWVYYPRARPFLAKIKPEKSQLPSLGENLDDVLHFRHFSSVIYKDASLPYGNFRSEVPFEYQPRLCLEEESEKRYLEMVEKNFSLWVYFNSKGK